MGRPSVASERVEQILRAVGRCVVRFGIDGLTLEKVAAESGLSRSHVRHYVGNKSDLIALYRDRVIELNTPPALSAAADAGLSATELVMHLYFNPEADLDEYATIDAILAAARHDPGLLSDVRSVYEAMERFIASAAAADHPDWDRSRADDVAAQTLTLAYGFWGMTGVGLISGRSESVRDLARNLLGLDPHT